MKSHTQSPKDPSFVQDPYPFYDRLRTEGPLFYWQDYALPCVLDHQAVNQIMKDRRLGRAIPVGFEQAIPKELQPFYDVEAHSMLDIEPPRHTRLRGLVLRAFTSREISAMRDDIINLCHELIDAMPDGPFDILSHFANRVPVLIIARLLGVPETRADDLLDWSHAMVAMYRQGRTKEEERAAIKATTSFVTFLREYITLRRTAGGDDLISRLIAAQDNDGKLSDDELISTCILLLNAGHEATVHALGNGIKTILETGVDRVVTPELVEEVLRFDPPLHMFTRWVYEDVTLFGHDFKRGDQIGCLLGAANRDKQVWTDANTFNPTRKITANTAFGAGIHFCVGAPLARLEMTLALEVLFKRLPDLKLAKAPIYADTYHFHGLESLIVTKD